MNHEYEYQTFTEDLRMKSGKVWATLWITELIKNLQLNLYRLFSYTFWQRVSLSPLNKKSRKK